MVITSSNLFKITVTAVAALITTVAHNTCFSPWRSNTGICPFPVWSSIPHEPQGICDVPEKFNKDYSTCDGLDQLNDQYLMHQKVGHGYQVSALVVTHKHTGIEYVARLPHNTSANAKHADKFDQITVGKAFCNQRMFMQLHDVVCHQGLVVPLWQKCAGQPLPKIFPEQGCLDISLVELRQIMTQLFKAVNTLFKLNLWHSDLRPNNIMYDRDSGQICIIDFGTTIQPPESFYSPENKAQSESLVYDRIHHSYKAKDRVNADDILAVGTLLSAFMSIPKRYVLKDGDVKFGFWTFAQMAKLIGKNELRDYTQEFGLQISDKIASDSSIPDERVDWQMYRNKCNEHLFNKDTVSLLNGLFQYSYFDRVEFFSRQMQMLPHFFFDG